MDESPLHWRGQQHPPGEPTRPEEGDIDRAGFLAALAQRLDAIVPRPMRVGFCDGELVYSHDWWSGALWGSEEALWERTLADVFAQLLDSFQDQVVYEVAWDSWPTPGLPRPDACIEGDHLQVWFGDRAAPALALPPIDLRPLRRSPTRNRL